MLECLIIGDSLAVGVGQNRPDCTVEAKVGITSGMFVKTYISDKKLPKAKKTLISLGSNDLGVDSVEAMKKVREQLKGEVTWILSANNRESAFAALQIAKEYGDNVMDVLSYPLSPDGVHPTGKAYKMMAKDF